MSKMAEEARAAMKKKAATMTKSFPGGKADPHEKVDSSDWTPPEDLDAGVKTGLRPISRRAFKKGGKVEGECAPMRADRKPRKAGGRSEAKEWVNQKINRNVKDANEEREGIKQIGGMKTGGRAKKFLGGPMMQPGGMMTGAMPSAGNAAAVASPSGLPLNDPREAVVAKNRMNFGMGASGNPYKKGGKVEHDDVAADKALIRKMVKPSARTGKEKGGKIFSGKGYPEKVPGAVPGGRTARARGGKAGKSQVNIVIAGHPGMGHGDGAMQPPGGMPPRPAGGQPVAVPPPNPTAGAPAPAVMPVAMPMPGGAPPQQPPMGRKHGGRTPLKMEFGAGGGEGRLEKIKEYGLKGPKKIR